MLEHAARPTSRRRRASSVESLALPALRAQARGLGEPPAGQLPGAAWQVPQVRCAPSAGSTRWSNCSPACCSRPASGASAPGSKAAWRWCFSGFLVAMAGIDLRTTWLPDQLTLPLLWVGLLASLVTVFVDPVSAILGAAAGYLEPVERVLAVQAGHRQGRHGLRRLQVARRARRLVRHQGDPADPADLVAGRRGDRRRPGCCSRARTGPRRSPSAPTWRSPAGSSSSPASDLFGMYLTLGHERADMAAFVVAVTGGIASGKSAVTALFEARWASSSPTPTGRARAVVTAGQPALAEIAARFGAELHRARRHASTGCACARWRSPTRWPARALEAITHPRIRAALEGGVPATRWAPTRSPPFPLLAESGSIAA